MDNGKDLKKRIVSAATAASLMVGGAFSPPAELPEHPMDKAGPPAIIEVITPDFIDDDDDGDSLVVPEEEKKRKGLKQRALVAVPLVLVTWMCGIGVASIAAATLGPIIARVLGWFITAALLLVTYFAVSKIMFPELKVKQILNGKAILAILIGSTVVSLILKGIEIFT